MLLHLIRPENIPVKYSNMEITSTFSIPDKELLFSFINASGPGGQNVNKVSTAVQLRFDVHNSSSLKEDTKARLIELAGRRITKDGILIIIAKRYRTQEQNRVDALQRFSSLIQKALTRNKFRHSTHPTASSKIRRITSKKKRGEIKRLRQATDE